MNILFDQGTPVPLRRLLHPHNVDTAAERGWSQLENGDLIQQAEDEGYEVMITTDQNIRYQQNFRKKNPFAGSDDDLVAQDSIQGRWSERNGGENGSRILAEFEC